LGAIKNAGEAALNQILAERAAHGPFQSVADLCERVDLKRVGKRPLEYMIKAHVFDCWGTPPQLMDALDRMVSYSGTEHAAASIGQMSLFGGATGTPTLKVAVDLLHPLEQVAKVDHKVLLEWEKEALGVHVSEHPLERPLASLTTLTTAAIPDIDANWHTKTVKLAGMISHLRTLTTKKGEPMAFAVLEDLDGKIDLVFFPRTWKECREVVAVDQVLLVMGKVQVKGDELSVLVDRVSANAEVALAAEEEPAYLGLVNGNGHGHGNGYSTGHENGNGRTTYTPPPPEDDFIAEPPPDFEPELMLAAVPPPPPNFEEAEVIGNQLSVIGNRTIMDSDEGVTAVATPPPTISRRPPATISQRALTVVVEIRPSGNWQKVCRDIVRLANEYEGPDGLTIHIAGQGLKMELGHGRTRSCPELFDALRLISGIARVYND
jgi:DNA polymerase-3 subunit alpha